MSNSKFLSVKLPPVGHSDIRQDILAIMQKLEEQHARHELLESIGKGGNQQVDGGQAQDSFDHASVQDS